MSAGIYVLMFPTTDRVYIGRSSNIEDRFARHTSALYNNTHHSAKLQAYFNSTKSDMTYEVLVIEPDIAKQILLEIDYIHEFDAYISGFNMTPGGEVVGSGYMSSNAKYSRAQYVEVFTLLAYTTKTSTEISEITGVSPAVIHNIASGRRHTWLQEEYGLEWEIISAKNRNIHPDRGEAIAMLKAVYSNPTTTLTHLASMYSFELKKLEHLVYGGSYTWLAKTHPIEYSKVVLSRRKK